MKYEVLTYGDPALREKARTVEEVNDEIRQLASDMLATMYGNEGLGLAAQQIGRTESICVVDVPPHEEHGTIDKAVPLVLINPSLTESSGEQAGKEGCLSFPEIFVSIKRPDSIAVVYRDLDYKEQTVHATGLYSRAIQHELEHLDGILLVDNMSVVQKLAVAGKLKRLKKSA